MTVEEYYKLKSMIKICNQVIGVKCECCRSNKKCREYLKLKQYEEEQEINKNEQNFSEL